MRLYFNNVKSMQKYSFEIRKWGSVILQLENAKNVVL